jgi:hypothetical protein
MSSLDTAIAAFADLIVEDLGGGNVRIKPIEEAVITAGKDHILTLLEEGEKSNDIVDTPLSRILAISHMIESTKDSGVAEKLSDDTYTFLESTITDIVTKLLKTGAIVDDDIKDHCNDGTFPEYIKNLLAGHIHNNKKNPHNNNNNNKKNPHNNNNKKNQPGLNNNNNQPGLNNKKNQPGLNNNNNQPGLNNNNIQQGLNNNNNQPGLNQANNGQGGDKKGGKSRTRNRKAKSRKGARTKRVRNAKTRKASRRS